ncbi:MAG TPA: sigma-70 family RNA polymerase sigma factor [Solirubrobacteraceae bacterium]|nr:sigma-70 family RNA polymerase sigma factor [Solirubrobacteraceae bacterium]
MAATSAGLGASAGRDRSDTAEEARLAHAAAAGDGAAFATLYDRYESRIFNFCHRLLASRDDAADATQEAFLKVLQRLPKLEGRELNFSAYLFTAARNASYDMIGKRKRAEPTDQVPEPSRAQEPGDLDGDPERAAMLTSLQDDVRNANTRLPERQREVLALRELEELSYDEIAEIMEMNRNSVAQLISRARISLRDELRGTALASVAASSPDCERALPLIAQRQDRELDDAEDRTWLAEHVAGCDSCRVAQEAVQEAGISYRAWLPILPAAWLWHATAARAAELVGADWSNITREHPRQTDGEGSGNGQSSGGEGGSANGVGAGAAGGQGPVAGAAAATMTLPAVEDAPLELADEATRRRRLLTGALLAVILLLGFSTAVAIGTDGAPHRLFDTTGGASFSTPAALGAAAAGAGATSSALKKHKSKTTTPYGNLVTFSTSTPTSTGDQNTGAGNGNGSGTGTPHQRTTHTPGGTSVGGQENGSSSIPTTSTPSTPSVPDTPIPPTGGAPPGATDPTGGGTPPPTNTGPPTRPPGAGPPPRR